MFINFSGFFKVTFLCISSGISAAVTFIFPCMGPIKLILSHDVVGEVVLT